MKVLVVNLADSASLTIRDALLEDDAWQIPNGTFRGHCVWQRGYDMMVQVDGPTIHDEDLSRDLRAMDWPIDAVWFLSRHRAASGQPSLTVHPIGNHRGADFGGQDETLSPAAPRDMGALLRRLKVHRDRLALPHQVTYEATHHGPLMDLPSLFVEIGSNEDWYEDKPSGEALAAAITDVLDAPSQAAGTASDRPIVIGAGGGHYVPQQTDRAQEETYDFGHFLPAYAIDPNAGPEALRRCIEATPGCVGLYMHKKGMKGPQRQAIKVWCEELGLAIV